MLIARLRAPFDGLGSVVAVTNALPSEAIAHLTPAGLDPRRLDITIEDPSTIEDEAGLPVASDLIGALASALREAGQASQDYATQYLEDLEHGPLEPA